MVLPPKSSSSSAVWGSFLKGEMGDDTSSASSSAGRPTTARDVLLYAPNVIGYVRVGCALSAFGLMIYQPDRWLLALHLYVAAFAGDLFDGLIARSLDQCSSYGGLLDMVTDRCSTAGLLYRPELREGELKAHQYGQIQLGRTQMQFLGRLDPGETEVQPEGNT